MHSLPQIEKIIRDNAPLFKKTHIPETIQFKLNLIRKNSPHVALGLVVVDEKENPYFVIKIPQQFSKVCDEAIEREYKFLTLLSKMKDIKDTVPKPINFIAFKDRKMAVYTYVSHHMVYEPVESCTDTFKKEWVQIPLNWLKEFHGQLKLKVIDETFMTHFFNNEPNRVVDTLRSDIHPLLESVKSLISERLKLLLIHDIPLGLSHGDFNMWNVGIQDSGKLAVFDWEDAEEHYPLLFDYFYFFIVFYWGLFWAHDKNKGLDANFIQRNMDPLISMVQDCLANFQKTYPTVTMDDIDTLFMLFLYRNICIDSEIKRSSKVNISRWVNIINGMKKPPFFINYFEQQKESLLSKRS
ncbi:MAG: phosphotransferase [Candidatus Margulisbacteria bacterium]|nr:phosphotransferase [Candidatus Margulisiibacteriota bacterium]